MLRGTLIGESLRPGATLDLDDWRIVRVARWDLRDSVGPSQPGYWTVIDFEAEAEAEDWTADRLADALAGALAREGAGTATSRWGRTEWSSSPAESSGTRVATRRAGPRPSRTVAQSGSPSTSWTGRTEPRTVMRCPRARRRLRTDARRNHERLLAVVDAVFGAPSAGASLESVDWVSAVVAHAATCRGPAKLRVGGLDDAGSEMSDAAGGPWARARSTTSCCGRPRRRISGRTVVARRRSAAADRRELLLGPVAELTTPLGVGANTHGVLFDASSRIHLHDAWKSS
ncbi:MAG: peptide/nickel transport system substrate-binding protein [Pseudonocardiales bacterium]|jgi:hypothetical protein|nr:peptide/nickel transport system substrate-binding protein [Pseudonocardiales bacterium]